MCNDGRYRPANRRREVPRDQSLQAQDERAGWRRSFSDRVRHFREARSPHWYTVAALLVVIVVAALLRLPGLLSEPPGFRHEEATVALAAGQIERGFFPIYFREGSDTIEPAFVYAVSVTSRLVGSEIGGPRLAAALLGIAAAAGCALWYRQAIGAGWALAGGLLVATSFWQIVFSRQAVPAITMAAVGAVALWALFRANGKRVTQNQQTVPSAWYGIAGLLFGFGIYTDVTMLAVLPVALAIGIFFLLKKGYLYPAADRRGLLLGAAVMLLAAGPLLAYFWQEPESFRQSIDNLRGDDPLIRGAWSTLDAIAWSGESDPAHTLSGKPLLDPVLLVWSLLGLTVVLRRPLDSLHATSLIWLAGFLAAAVVIAPGSHAQLLVLTPVLFLLPVLGMRAALDFARARSSLLSRVILAAVVLSIGASATWSIVSYRQWTNSDETYFAFAGDVRDAIDALPDDDQMVYFATGDSGRIVRYLAPEGPRRDFDNPDILPLPATGPAYLAVPASSELPESLGSYLGEETLMASGSAPEGAPAFHVWLIDDRVRDRLPYAVPAIFFEGGPALVGFEVAPVIGAVTAPAIEVVLVHRVSPGGEPFSALLRLVEPGEETGQIYGTAIQPAPDNAVPHDEMILSRIILPFPETPGMVADLHTALESHDGEFLIPRGSNVIVYDDVWALLNAIGYIGPQP